MGEPGSSVRWPLSWSWVEASELSLPIKLGYTCPHATLMPRSGVQRGTLESNHVLIHPMRPTQPTASFEACTL